MGIALLIGVIIEFTVNSCDKPIAMLEYVYVHIYIYQLAFQIDIYLLLVY